MLPAWDGSYSRNRRLENKGQQERQGHTGKELSRETEGGGGATPVSRGIEPKDQLLKRTRWRFKKE